MQAMLSLSDAIDRVLQRIASATGWLFLALVAVICWDVLTRKLGFQIPGFGSTPIQELEWHLHGMLFMFWLGYAYIRNVHVRIDVFTSHKTPREQAKLELFGIFVFAIPYCLLATYFAYLFAQTSFLQNESSDAPNGLPYRWIIKACLFLGLVLLDAAVASVMFRKLVQVFGPPDLAARAATPAASH
ncbi:MAG: TRAP transporter small permease subunit [Reyranella sp.]|jgi:TRAP-type mannitol/chloroaromatic compound transport system permease small subunit|nr:TRAP transporter small permease subunit [Reyranella sp.]